MNNRRAASRRRPTQQRPSRHRKRMFLMQGGLLLLLGCVAVRMPYVQRAFGVTLTKDAKEVQQVDTVMLAPRGTLLDAHGHRLAYDISAFWVDIKSGAFEDKHQLAQLLAPGLSVSADSLAQYISSVNSKSWMHWSHPVLEDAKEKMMQALSKVKDDSGNPASFDVTFTPTEKRFYPYATFAANTIGYIDQDRKGQAGLEYQYNQQLSGVNGMYTYTKDGQGFPISSTVTVTKKPKPGLDVQLTLDQTIQGFVESKMDELVAKYKPEHAAIVVMNPKTGGILGMASRPTFDPNAYFKANWTQISNWAVNAQFEPGSTFKVTVLAAGLSSGAIHMSDTLYDPGYTFVSNLQINDWKYGGFGLINYEQALEVSSNVAFAKAALKMGWPTLYSYIGKFGYLHPTGVDLPSEAQSIMFSPKDTNQVEIATSGFGQGISVTPMQQMAAVAAIANGGKLMKPYLAESFIDPTNGKVVRQVEPTVVDPHVVPPDVAAEVNDAMIKDISVGIDSLGYISGYDVGGKTGTAQIHKPGGGYYTDRFETSFIGYAPGWDPQVEVYVTLYHPNVPADQQWGSTIATPAARDILQECMQYYHIAPRASAVVPSLEPKAKAVTQTEVPTKYTETPNLVGLPAAKIGEIAKKYGLQIEAVGGQGAIQNQWPAAGVEVACGTKMYAYSPAAGTSGKVQMPDLTGVSMREAGDILASMGLKIAPRGTGFVVSQSTPAGQSVTSGATVTVTCAPPSNPSLNNPGVVAGASNAVGASTHH